MHYKPPTEYLITTTKKTDSVITIKTPNLSSNEMSIVDIAHTIIIVLYNEYSYTELLWAQLATRSVLIPRRCSLLISK